MSTENFLDRIVMIQSDQIDAQDRLYAISLPWLPIDELIQSVQETGILSPLHVQRTELGQFRVIMGFRRYEAARKLGLREIPCIVREEEDGFTLLVQALQDNRVTRPLHLLEKALLLLRLREHFGLSEQALLDDFMELLNLPADRFHLQQCLDLARLPELLQRTILDPLEPEIVLKLARWKTEEQEFFHGIASKFRLGKNKQKKLFNLLDELRALSGTTPAGLPATGSLSMLWKESGAAEIEQDERLSPSDGFDKVFEKLRRLRFPRLSACEQEYERLKAALKLPPQIQFRAPRYFEGKRIDVLLSFQSTEELFEGARKLDEIAKTDEVRQILELL